MGHGRIKASQASPISAIPSTGHSPRIVYYHFAVPYPWGMADNLTPLERSERMARIGSKNTRPELVVRSLVHNLGYRYRLHRKDLPGKPDLVFPRLNKVMFVHGCFWHRHPEPRCPLARLPKSRLDFWLPKLETNQVRDVHHKMRLIALGWQVHVVWECELRQKEHLKNELRRFLSGELCALSNSSQERGGLD
ncbi:MAG: DNA mismatch endonuclease Vsr [Fimbriimonadaceae bacterium]